MTTSTPAQLIDRLHHLNDAKPLCDDLGQNVHGCPAAIPLSYAREAMLRLLGDSPNDGIVPYIRADAAYYYDRALNLADVCADCQGEATEWLDLLLEAQP